MPFNINLTASDEELREKFFALQIPEDIADLLEVNSYDFLKYLLFVLPSARRYKRFSIPKKRGGNRIILEPTPNLKIIQQKLLQVLYAVYEPKSSVHGFIGEKSIVTNARQHVRKRYVLNVDLQNFFPSIHFGRVRGMFMAYPYNLNDAVATVLAQICSLPDQLPQGAPTSPIISNMICAKMDSQLQKLAKEHRCYYTRYADDLTFSTYVSRFPKSLAIVVRDEAGQHIEVGSELAEIIHQNGFKINKSKVRLQTKEQRQEVTGLTTNLFVNVNRKFIRQIRAMLHAWEKFGYQAAEDEYRVKYSYRNEDKPYKTLPSFQQVVKGKIEFVGMVRGRTDHIFVEFNNKAVRLERESALHTRLFNFLKSADAHDEILSLIASGETPEVEFKEGACLDPHTNKKNNRMRENIVEEVAAFMNSYPRGTVFIGVADDGKICGVEREYSHANPQKGNWDAYELFLTDVLNSSLSIANPDRFYTISRYAIQGKTVCVIRTTKADEPVLSKGKLFIRSGTQCKELKDDQMIGFIRNWE